MRYIIPLVFFAAFGGWSYWASVADAKAKNLATFEKSIHDMYSARKFAVSDVSVIAKDDANFVGLATVDVNGTKVKINCTGTIGAAQKGDLQIISECK